MIAAKYWWAVRLLGVACLLLVSGCSADGGSEKGEGTEVRLQEAAALLEARLGEGFAETFAGIVVDVERGVVIVYRLEDAELESTAEELAGAVPVEFVDADFSLAAMAAVVAQVEDDLEYWREQGIAVNGAAPRSDGAGVTVYVASPGEGAFEAVQARYAPMVVFVEDRSIVVPTGEPLPPMPEPSGGLESREGR